MRASHSFSRARSRLYAHRGAAAELPENTLPAFSRTVEQRRRKTTINSWAADMCHPLPLVAIAVLLLNDHWLKGSGLLPGAVTGKLSDVAGLFFFPILCVVLARGLLVGLGMSRAAHERALIGFAVAMTAAGFACLKLWPELNAALAKVWGKNVMDRSDLYAIPVLALSWSWLLDRRRSESPLRRRRPTWAQACAIALAAFASMATPAPRYSRNFPAWKITTGAEHTQSCVASRAWISKSGKTGVGLTIELRKQGDGECLVRIAGAELALAGSSAVAANAASSPIRLQGVHHIYLPFLFDNNRMWNQGIRHGTFRLELTVNDQAARWEMAAEHRLNGYHLDTWQEKNRQWGAR